MKKEYIKNIERLEIMEEKFGITLEGLNAEISFYEDEDNMADVHIYGEIYSTPNCQTVFYKSLFPNF